MKQLRTIALAAGAAMALGAQAASALDEITVAYFLEWPMPFQHAKVEGAYDKALGLEVNWVSFESGTAMSAAMASGDVQMAVSQGATPLVVATSAGQDLQILSIQCDEPQRLHDTVPGLGYGGSGICRAQ